jgi:3-methyl-2-oxobutanoate hydroxymethyltransferase
MSITALNITPTLTVNDFQKRKLNGPKISMVTCYDYTSAVIMNASQVDCILVGDSGSMVMHGCSTTLGATVDMMVQHTLAVAKGAPNKFIVGDLPFCSYRKSRARTMDAVEKIMRAGAQAVKLEGAAGNLEIVRHIVESGVPVMGHLGLTPQAIHALGGFKVQGRVPEAAAKLIQEAEALAAAGCFALVLECVPSALAQQITDKLSIPTIGIGAGPHTSGQVLVFQDLLGLSQAFKPKFLKTFLNGFELVRAALNAFDEEVKQTTYPDLKEHCY